MFGKKVPSLILRIDLVVFSACLSEIPLSFKCLINILHYLLVHNSLFQCNEGFPCILGGLVEDFYNLIGIIPSFEFLISLCNFTINVPCYNKQIGIGVCPMIWTWVSFWSMSRSFFECMAEVFHSVAHVFLVFLVHLDSLLISKLVGMCYACVITRMSWQCYWSSYTVYG